MTLSSLLCYFISSLYIFIINFLFNFWCSWHLQMFHETNGFITKKYSIFISIYPQKIQELVQGVFFYIILYILSMILMLFLPFWESLWHNLCFSFRQHHLKLCLFFVYLKDIKWLFIYMRYILFKTFLSRFYNNRQ